FSQRRFLLNCPLQGGFAFNRDGFRNEVGLSGSASAAPDFVRQCRGGIMIRDRFGIDRLSSARALHLKARPTGLMHQLRELAPPFRGTVSFFPGERLAHTVETPPTLID